MPRASTDSCRHLLSVQFVEERVIFPYLNIKNNHSGVSREKNKRHHKPRSFLLVHHHPSKRRKRGSPVVIAKERARTLTLETFLRDDRVMKLLAALLLLPALSQALSLNRIRSVGGGLPVVPAGNLNLFDPNTDGKLQGTGILQVRLKQANNYLPAAPPNVVSTIQGVVPSDANLLDCQAWLEHLDEDIPLNTVKPSAPVDATMLGRTRLISTDAPGDIQHIILKLPEGFHYIEGQSLSVIPNLGDGVKHKPRLYSIASTRYGDILDGTTVSLCVRRAECVDPNTGIVDPTKAGVCSNFLCNALPGTTIKVAGPVGKTMLLPKDPTTDIIMVATGTGIAPFRSFLHRLFMEHTVARHLFQGNAWLILGVPTTGGLLYPQEFQAMQQQQGKCVETRRMCHVRAYARDVLTQQACTRCQRPTFSSPRSIVD